MFLPRCPGVFGMSLAVQTALIADTDTFTVEATGVRTDAFERTGRFDVPILANIKMIPHTVETTTTVANVQVVLGETLVLTSGGKVDNDHTDSSHALPLFRWIHSLLTHCRAIASDNLPFSEKISECISFTRSLRLK